MGGLIVDESVKGKHDLTHRLKRLANNSADDQESLLE